MESELPPDSRLLSLGLLKARERCLGQSEGAGLEAVSGQCAAEEFSLAVGCG